MNKFDVIFLTEAREFLFLLDEKSRDKVIFNIDKAKVKWDNDLFKKRIRLSKYIFFDKNGLFSFRAKK